MHGLNGDPFNTFTADNGKLWLRDFLPRQIPDSRIMTFGCNSTLAGAWTASGMIDFVRDLLDRLSGRREESNVGDREDQAWRKYLISGIDKNRCQNRKISIESILESILTTVPHHFVHDPTSCTLVQKSIHSILFIIIQPHHRLQLQCFDTISRNSIRIS